MRVEFRPAPPETGLVFVRSDLDPPARLPARVEYRVEVPRRTTLASGGAAVEMVEHLLAACLGLQIDNCEIWVDQPELPGCDGSSLPFVQALEAAGAVEQEAARAELVVARAIRVGDEHSWVEARPAPQRRFSVSYRLDYGSGSVIGRQKFATPVDPPRFARELAPARTFLLSDEARWLRNRGLGERVTCQDVLVFDEQGVVDNSLRFEDECVRHKALDLVGDLALAGCDLVGDFVAHRSGHRLNAELVRVLLAAHQENAQRRMTA